MDGNSIKQSTIYSYMIVYYETMLELGIPRKLIQLSKVCRVEIKNGRKQRGALIPLLFNLAIEKYGPLKLKLNYT